MISRAILRYVRLSPRKFRLIIPLVKGKRAEDAIAILGSVKKRASSYGIDLIKSAIANAKIKAQGIDTSTLYITKLVADPGPMLKRFRAASMGRAGSIHKHTSHITVELDQLKGPAETKETVKQEQKVAAKPHAAHKPEKAQAQKGARPHAPAKRLKIKHAAKK
jgi:large subunit ribosomal protein L22